VQNECREEPTSHQHRGHPCLIRALEVCGTRLPEFELVRRMARAIDDVYSGVVHGSLSSILELYEGGDWERFRVHGMLGTPRIRTHRVELCTLRTPSP
jgi:hypothetical protein